MNHGRLLGVGKPSPLCPTIDDDKDPVFYRHPGNCSVYFLCSHGFAYEFQCPARLHFNLKEKICDYESTVNCTEAIKFYERYRRLRPTGQFEWGDFAREYACFFCKEE
ncbi:hypothetical protein JTE90_001396 [Oedothorax gibbosus]|uniref:Chitin-binding type-2 domain-containing protein n=1 Tax=Oedothorax gibbosus TaxID=931172 RepID=A0AAV6VHC7_9ARAC|nr:hypothetical protein JTE90_001396 [Oedothorax gibbosus]